MSRCFPYLAIANRVRDESLIDSIKLQSHKRKAEKELTNEEKEKKQRKLEKKQRRLEKKEKKQRKLEKKQRKLEKKQRREKKKASRAQVDATKLADQTPSTKVAAQVENREGSGLTEEHEMPFKENLCYLSDGTQQSNKRPREALSSEDSQDEEPNDVKISHLASTSTSTPNEEKLPEKISSVSTISPQEVRLPEKICSTTTPKVAKLPEIISSTTTPKVAKLPEKISGPTTPTVAKLPEKISGSRIADDRLYNNGKKHRQAQVYKALLEDWVPILLSLPNDQDDGDDWLLPKKQKLTQTKRTRTDTSHVTSLYNASRNSNLLGPKACYLPAADIYALPYTLPF